jgi:hypothetical protein
MPGGYIDFDEHSFRFVAVVGPERRLERPKLIIVLGGGGSAVVIESIVDSEHGIYNLKVSPP